MRDAVGTVDSVLLLGGTSDIGAATVRALVRDGARRVVLAARDPQAAEPLAGELRGAGTEVSALAFDARDLAGHADVVEAAFAAAGGDLDLAVVAFGILGGRGEHQLEHAADLHLVNGTGAVSVMSHLADRMRRQGHGTICLLSSVAADRPRSVNFAYGSSKTAADAFARGLREQLLGTGVDVLIVRPGFVKSAMTSELEAPPIAVSPEKVAEAVLSGLRQRRAVVYVPAPLSLLGAVLRVLPAPVLRKLPL